MSTRGAILSQKAELPRAFSFRAIEDFSRGVIIVIAEAFIYFKKSPLYGRARTFQLVISAARHKVSRSPAASTTRNMMVSPHAMRRRAPQCRGESDEKAAQWADGADGHGRISTAKQEKRLMIDISRISRRDFRHARARADSWRRRVSMR